MPPQETQTTDLSMQRNSFSITRTATSSSSSSPDDLSSRQKNTEQQQSRDDELPAVSDATATSKNHANADSGEQNYHCRSKMKMMLSPTISLPLIVMIDMLAVSLVVPLLHQYYKLAGVQSAGQRELLSSLYSSSQIIGGLVIGALSDAGILSRRNILFLSFAGSAVSYGLIVRGSLAALVVSRVVVGLVKQTMTVTTAVMARHTTKEDRTKYVGRLTASSTVAWIAGPSVGALLYKHIDETAPAFGACGLFVLNSILVAIILPKDDDGGAIVDSADGTSSDKSYEATKTTGSFSSSSSFSSSTTTTNNFKSFLESLKSCFKSRTLANVVTSLLIYRWMQRATSYASMASYYEEMYGIEPHQRGYISSYQMMLNFVVQSTLVRHLVKMAGGERNAACMGAALVAISTFLEYWSSLKMFILLICPAVAVSMALLGLCLRSLITQVAPKESLGSVLASLDVLSNATAVTVPFYRTALFAAMGRLASDEEATMKGDPNPYFWLISSGLHWVVATLAIGFLLLGSRMESSAKLEEGKKDE